MADNQIVDPYGAPLIKIDAGKPVTSEIASAATDIYLFQGYLQVMENPDKVLNLEAGGDISVYDDIGRDPRIAAGLRTRAKAVTGKEWDVIPFSQEKVDIDIAAYVKKAFLAFPYDRSRRAILRGGLLKGFSVAEVMWDYSEGDTFIADLRYRHQRRFKFDKEGRLHLLTLENPYPGEDVTQRDGLPLKKFCNFVFGDEPTTPYGVGLGYELYWPWWFKKNGIKFWLLFCEKFSAPTVKGEYPSGASKDDQDKLLAAAAAVHANSAVIYPQGMSLSLMEAARSGSISSHKELVEFMNEEITIAIQGQTATTTGTKGKLGNSQEQADVRDDYTKDDADSLCEPQNAKNGLIRWLVDYQFPGVGRYPQVWIKTETETDGKTLSERDKNLADAMTAGGRYRLGRSYWMKTYSLDEKDLEDLPASTPLSQPGRSVGGVELAFAEGINPQFTPDQQAAERLKSASADEWEKVMAGLMEPIKTIIEGANSYEEAQARLADAYGQMDDTALAELLARACFGAKVAGRVVDGNA